MPMKKATARKRINAAKRKAKKAETKILAEYRESQRKAKKKLAELQEKKRKAKRRAELKAKRDPYGAKAKMREWYPES